MLAAITGLAALLHASAVAFQTLKYLGVAYLLYMAWSMLRDRARSRSSETAPRSARAGDRLRRPDQPPQPEADALLLRLPAAVREHRRSRTRPCAMLGLSAVFMLVTFVVFAVYGVFAAAVRSHVISRPRV